MKKRKTNKEFYYKDLDKQEIINLVNNELPINLKYLENLIDRIHKRYPIVDKVQVSIIVKATFESLRELLILGNIINLNKFIFDMKLHCCTYISDKLYPVIKVKLTTPPIIKNN